MHTFDLVTDILIGQKKIPDLKTFHMVTEKIIAKKNYIFNLFEKEDILFLMKNV